MLPQRVLTKIASYDDILSIRMQRVNKGSRNELEHRSLRRILLDRYRILIESAIKFVDKLAANPEIATSDVVDGHAMFYDPVGCFNKYVHEYDPFPELRELGVDRPPSLEYSTPARAVFIFSERFEYNSQLVQSLVINYEIEDFREGLYYKISGNAVCIHTTVLLFLWNSIVREILSGDIDLYAGISMILELMPIVSEYYRDRGYDRETSIDCVDGTSYLIYKLLSECESIKSFKRIMFLFSKVQLIGNIDGDILWLISTAFANLVNKLGLQLNTEYRKIAASMMEKSIIKSLCIEPHPKVLDQVNVSYMFRE
jgi:hypothetical protein